MKRLNILITCLGLACAALMLHAHAQHNNCLPSKFNCFDGNNNYVGAVGPFMSTNVSAVGCIAQAPGSSLNRLEESCAFIKTICDKMFPIQCNKKCSPGEALTVNVKSCKGVLPTAPAAPGAPASGVINTPAAKPATLAPTEI